MNKKDLTNEEQEILDAYERGEWKRVKDFQAQAQEHQAAAHMTARKDARINIRINSMDLQALQIRALEEGIPYQTLIASILHKYVNGRLVGKV